MTSPNPMIDCPEYRSSRENISWRFYISLYTAALNNPITRPGIELKQGQLINQLTGLNDQLQPI